MLYTNIIIVKRNSFIPSCSSVSKHSVLIIDLPHTWELWPFRKSHNKWSENKFSDSRSHCEEGFWRTWDGAWLLKWWVSGEVGGPRGPGRRPAAWGIRASDPALAIHDPHDLLNVCVCQLLQLWDYLYHLFLPFCLVSTRVAAEFSSWLLHGYFNVLLKHKSTRTSTRGKTSYQPTLCCSLPLDTSHILCHKYFPFRK